MEGELTRDTLLERLNDMFEKFKQVTGVYNVNKNDLTDTPKKKQNPRLGENEKLLFNSDFQKHLDNRQLNEEEVWDIIKVDKDLKVKKAYNEEFFSLMYEYVCQRDYYASRIKNCIDLYSTVDEFTKYNISMYNLEESISKNKHNFNGVKVYKDMLNKSRKALEFFKGQYGTMSQGLSVG